VLKEHLSVDNVINFMAYKKFREDMEHEKLREDIMEFFFNADAGVPDSFEFTLELDDE
jgi:hypothetical protein